MPREGNGKKKKRFWDRRREFLEGYELNEEGKYVYAGKAYSWDVPRGKTLAFLWSLSVLTFLVQIGAGCLPHVGMNGRAFVLLPYAAGLIAAGSLIWAVYELTDGGDPLRAYSYKKSVERLPGRCIFVMVCCGLSILGELINLMWQAQFDGSVSGALVYMLTEAVSLALALLIRMRFAGFSWTFIEADSGESEGEKR